MEGKLNPPSLIRSITAGFDAITNNLFLILFPITLDIFLWFGPRLHLQDLMTVFFKESAAIPELQTPEWTQMVAASQQMWAIILERFNLFTLLRTYPVGITSLMAGVSPVHTPLGDVGVWEIPSWSEMFLLMIGLILLGLVLGTFYFSIVSQAAIKKEVDWRAAFQSLPWSFNQVLQLSLMWLGLLIAISLPFMCLLSLLLVSGLSIGPLVLLLYAGFVIWIMIPLIFSPLGIFVYHRKVWGSVKDGVRITRLTLPNTLVFLLLVFMLSRGLDLLWSIPTEESWMALVGIIGHGFVTTALLASVFIYYRDANTWVYQIVQKIQSASSRAS